MTSLHDRHINPLILKDLNGDNWPDIAAITSTGAMVVLLNRGRTGM
mgnify:CR=1 FL=1